LISTLILLVVYNRQSSTLFYLKGSTKPREEGDYGCGLAQAGHKINST
jgi:hypothetical protein